MNYLIEGPRNVGKSFLINELKKVKSEEYIFHKTRMFPIIDQIPDPYVFIGKDLPLLTMLSEGWDNMVIDRGFLSTLAYGSLFRRYSHNEMKSFLDYINQLTMDLTIVLVSGKNPNQNERHKDSFDELDNVYREQLECFEEYSKLITSATVIPFVNNFDGESSSRFINLF